MRRPQLYYAQCEPIPQTACGPDAEWLCAGWGRCVDAGEECTTSRCCSSPSLGCFLNTTLHDAGGGWHAHCLPLTQGTGRGAQQRVQLFPVQPGQEMESFDAAALNMTDEEYFYLRVSSSGHAFCEGTEAAFCFEAWQARADEAKRAANQLVRRYVRASGLSPLAITGIAVGGILLACCIALCAVAYRRRMQAQLLRLETELAEFRQAKREATEKRRGGEHVAALVEGDEARLGSANESER